LAKVAVQCSADTFAVNQGLVLRINISGKNRHLRQAAARWASLQNDSTTESSIQENLQVLVTTHLDSHL